VRAGTNSERFASLFSKRALLAALNGEAASGVPFRYAHHLTAVRYKDGKRTDVRPEGLLATSADAASLLDDEGATIQFQAPQRDSDDLWRLQAKLEHEFGCLVGASAYLVRKNVI
jgi:hypothetical protein